MRYVTTTGDWGRTAGETAPSMGVTRSPWRTKRGTDQAVDPITSCFYWILLDKVAERVGFEPTWGLRPQRISSPRRYGRFGTSPKLIIFGLPKALPGLPQRISLGLPALALRAPLRGVLSGILPPSRVRAVMAASVPLQNSSSLAYQRPCRASPNGFHSGFLPSPCGRRCAACSPASCLRVESAPLWPLRYLSKTHHLWLTKGPAGPPPTDFTRASCPRPAGAAARRALRHPASESSPRRYGRFGTSPKLIIFGLPKALPGLPQRISLGLPALALRAPLRGVLSGILPPSRVRAVMAASVPLQNSSSLAYQRPCRASPNGFHSGFLPSPCGRRCAACSPASCLRVESAPLWPLRYLSKTHHLWLTKGPAGPPPTDFTRASCPRPAGAAARRALRHPASESSPRRYGRFGTSPKLIIFGLPKAPFRASPNGFHSGFLPSPCGHRCAACSPASCLRVESAPLWPLRYLSKTHHLWLTKGPLSGLPQRISLGLPALALRAPLRGVLSGFLPPSRVRAVMAASVPLQNSSSLAYQRPCRASPNGFHSGFLPSPCGHRCAACSPASCLRVESAPLWPLRYLSRTGQLMCLKVLPRFHRYILGEAARRPARGTSPPCFLPNRALAGG